MITSFIELKKNLQFFSDSAQARLKELKYLWT